MLKRTEEFVKNKLENSNLIGAGELREDLLKEIADVRKVALGMFAEAELVDLIEAIDFSDEYFDNPTHLIKAKETLGKLLEEMEIDDEHSDSNK